MIHGGLFSGLFARGAAAAEVTESAFVQGMMDFEVALLRALGRAGIAPREAAAELEALADASNFDLAQLGRSARENATPVPGLLEALRARLSESSAEHLHQGATSQDVVDTAMMLICKRGLAPIVDDLDGCSEACVRMCNRYRETLAPGRTLLQQALPITFGLKTANWLVALDGARESLRWAQRDAIAIQLGGAVGTPASLGELGPEIASGVAAELGLAPASPWHTVRLRPAWIAGALGAALGAMGKIARRAARTDRGRRGDRGRRRFLDDAAQAKPDRGGGGGRVRHPRPRPGRHHALDDGSGARTRRGTLAGRVGDDA